MQFSCKAHCHLQPFYRSPVTSFYHVCSLWRYGKLGQKKPKILSSENLPPIYRHSYTLTYFLKCFAFCSFTDVLSKSCSSAVTSVQCSELPAATTMALTDLRNSCNSLFYSSVSRGGSQAALCKLNPLGFAQPSSTKEFYSSWRYLLSALHLKW